MDQETSASPSYSSENRSPSGEEQAEEEERNAALAAPSEERYPSSLPKLCSTKGLTSELRLSFS